MDFKNLLLLGHTGSGKTSFLINYINDLLSGNNHIIIFDPKTFDYIDYDSNPNIIRIIDPNKYISTLVMFINTRDNIINKNSKTFFLIDDIVWLYIKDNKLSKKWKKYVDSLLRSLANSEDVNLIISSQIKENISKNIKDIMNTQITLNNLYKPTNKLLGKSK